jgi:AcrR family transcriptional regulator
MARRSDHTREELAALVVEAAAALVGEDGLRGLAMRRIAERIGYAAGSIYNAVGDLDDVIFRVNARTLDLLSGRLAASAAALAAAPPIERALGLAEAYLEFVIVHRRLWGALFEHARPVEASLPPWFVAARDRPVAIVAAALAPLFPGGEDDRREGVLTLWAALQGVVAMSVDGTVAKLLPDSEPRRLVRLLVCRYLTGQGPSGDAQSAL